MLKQDFANFLNVLKVVKNYNIDVVIKDGKIFQMSDSRSCILDIDLSNLFEATDDKDQLVLMSIASKFDLFKVLYTLLESDEDSVSFKVIDNKILRLQPSNRPESLIDIRLASEEQVKSILIITNNIKEAVENSQQKVLLKQHFSTKDAKYVKTIHNQIKSGGVMKYYFNDKDGIILASGMGNSIVVKIGNWAPLITDLSSEDQLMGFEIMSDFVFPDTSSELDLTFYVKNADDRLTVIAQSNSFIDGCPISIYSLYNLGSVPDDDAKIALKYFSIKPVIKEIPKQVDEGTAEDSELIRATTSELKSKVQPSESNTSEPVVEDVDLDSNIDELFDNI